MKISPNAPCPCHSGDKYKKCCRPYHQHRNAPTPLALMRSRYSAYVLQLSDYIMATTHPDNPRYSPDAEGWRQDVLAFATSTQFVGLDILDFGEDFVIFHAILKQGDEDTSYTEHSLFKQHEGGWMYLSGEKQS